MPTYQYVCTNPESKHEFEVVQSFSDPAIAICPVCAAPVRKVYGSVGVVFKGSGFYRTDSRKTESATSPAASSSKEGASADGGSSTKDSSSKGSASAPAAKESSKSSSSTGSSSKGSATGVSGKAAN